MLITPLGDPIAPVRAQEHLRAVDPRLFLLWVKGVMNYWAICERWIERDVRREFIQNGSIAADRDFDVKCFLPRECSAEEVEGFVLRNFVRVTDAAKQGAEAVDTVNEYNAKHRENLIEAVIDEQGEKGKRSTKHDFEVQAGLATANAQVTVATNLTGGKGKRK
jgi:hypothetical protein